MRSAIEDYLACAALHRIDRVRYYVDVMEMHPDCTYGGKPTALCYALIQPHRNLMKFLMARGADVNRSDALGMTPLHYAALGGCEYCMAYIIRHGAERNARNVAGRTPLALIEERPHRQSGREFLARYGTASRWGPPPSKRFH